MKAKTEILLYQCLWMADMMMRPSWRNLNGSFEEWCYRGGMLRQIHRLEAQGWIESREGKDGTDRVVRLTDKAVLKALGGRQPVECWNRAWDGIWRMVVFDVPEQERSLRNKLRKQLQAARFGGLQGSVWISPVPMDGIAGIFDKASARCGVLSFFEGKTCGGESTEQMVSAAWDFEKINRRYAEYIQHLKDLPGCATADVKSSLQEWWEQERSLWLDCVELDPFLPRMLWPKGYVGEKAWKKKCKIMRVASRLASRL